MRILLVQDYLRAGGTEQHSLFLAEAFSQRGHDVTLLNFRPGGSLEPKKSKLSYRRIVLQKKDWKTSWFAPGWRKVISALKPDAVLLYGRNAHRLGGPIKSEYPKIKVIASLRTGRRLPPYYIDSLESSDGITVNSAYARDRLVDLKLAFELPVRLIPNPLLKQATTDAIQSERKKFREFHKIPEGHRVFLQVASLIPGKNHREMLHLLAKIKAEKDWTLWIVGNGPAEKRIQSAVRHLGLTDRVKLWGFQRNPMPFYAAADIFLTTSVEESLPNAVIEGQACGLPVVAYLTAGLPECVQDGVTGILSKQGDGEAWLAALKEVSNWLIKDKKGLGEKCRNYAFQEFSPDPLIERYLLFIEEVVQRRWSQG